MKKLLCALMCLGLLMGCSQGNEAKPKNEENGTKTVEKTDLEKVSEVFTLTVEQSNFKSNIVKAIDDQGNQFILYIDFQGTEKTAAESMNLKEHEIAFSNNNGKDSYFVDSQKIIISGSGETVESLSKKMNNLLKDKDLTIEQIRTALLEKYNKK